MNRKNTLGGLITDALKKNRTLRREDLGADACLSKKGMTFTTEAYAVEGVGHLCIMNMKAMLGMMKMETVVLSTLERDMPLFNLDWVGVFGKQTQIAELYDTQLAPFPQEAQDRLTEIKKRYADLQDYSSGKVHWYDSVLYPCSCSKTGKKVSDRLSSMAEEYVAAFTGLLAAAPACDRAEKEAKVRAYAERLVAEGGPAVDQVTKLFGRETASRLILQHMYGLPPKA